MDAGYRRLRLLLLALCLPGAGMLAPASAQGTPEPPAGALVPAKADASPSDTRPTSSKTDVENRAIRRSGTARTAEAGREGTSQIGSSSGVSMWLKTLGILGVVLALMGLVLKLLRRAGLGKSFGGSTAAVQILSRGYLTNKHQMVLVRLGQRILLVGVGPQNLDLLCEVSDPGEAAQILARLEGGKSGSISQDFQQTIDSAVQQYDRQGQLEPAVVEPPVTPDAPPINTLRLELKNLLAKMQSIGRK